jgi:hypothetical protein
LSASNVRSIESLESFHAGMMRLSSEWQKTVEEIRMLVQRAEDHFTNTRPSYWREQERIADRELAEAKNSLSIKRASVRPQDRPAASEATKRVRVAEARKRFCEDKKREAKKYSLEISRQCDNLLGPLADLAQHCDVALPVAAKELRGLIAQLKLYADEN